MIGNTRVIAAASFIQEGTDLYLSMIDVCPETEVTLCCKVSCNKRIPIDIVANWTVTLFPFQWQEELFTENGTWRRSRSLVFVFLTVRQHQHFLQLPETFDKLLHPHQAGWFVCLVVTLIYCVLITESLIICGSVFAYFMQVWSVLLCMLLSSYFMHEW